MSTTTTNYGLIKPDTTDPILIGQLNDNADTIDAALKENADAIENKPDAADIPAPSTTAPAMDGTGSAGTSNQYARADHVHPSDTSKQNALSSTQLAAVNSGIDSEKVSQIETNKNNISSVIGITGANITTCTGGTAATDNSYAFNNYPFSVPIGSYWVCFDTTATSGQAEIVFAGEGVRAGSHTFTHNGGTVSFVIDTIAPTIGLTCYSLKATTISNLRVIPKILHDMGYSGTAWTADLITQWILSQS